MNKKIGLLLGIGLVINSVVGVGIFFKNKELLKMANYDWKWVIMTWILAIIFIFLLVYCVSLMILSKTKENNLIGWVKSFTPNWFYKIVYFGFKYCFLPAVLFSSIFYLISVLVELNVLPENSFWLHIFLGFLFLLLIVIINIMSTNTSIFISKLCFFVKIISITSIPIIGYIYGITGEDKLPIEQLEQPKGLLSDYKWLIFLLGIPTILLSFDSFYVVAIWKDKFDNVKKIRKAMLIGVGVIATIYLIISAGLLVGTRDGAYTSLFSEKQKGIRIFFQCIIMIGVMGVINGITSNYVLTILGKLKQEDNKNEDVNLIHRIIFKDKNKTYHQKISVFVYVLSILIINFLIYTFIVKYGFTFDGSWNKSVYGDSTSLFHFSDLLMNYTSLFLFVVLSICSFGLLFNKEKLNQKLTRVNKIIIWITFITFSFFFISQITIELVEIHNYNDLNDKISSIAKLSIFGIFIGLSTILMLVEKLIIYLLKNSNKNKVAK